MLLDFVHFSIVIKPTVGMQFVVIDFLNGDMFNGIIDFMAIF